MSHDEMALEEEFARVPLKRKNMRRLMGYQCHGPILGWYQGNPDGY